MVLLVYVSACVSCTLLACFLLFPFFFFCLVCFERESLDLERWGSKEDLEGDEGGEIVIIKFEKNFIFRQEKQKQRLCLFS